MARNSTTRLTYRSDIWRGLIWVCCLLLPWFESPCFAQHESTLESPGQSPIQPFAPRGTLCLVGGGSIPSEVRELFCRAAKASADDSKLVIIPTASADADAEPDAYWCEPWQDSGFAQIVVLHSRDRQVADSPEFTAVLEDATGIWISGGAQNRLAEAYQGTATETMVGQRLQQGAAVGGTSAGAAIASRVMIASGSPTPKIATGFDLLPSAIIDQHYTQRERQTRLLSAVASHPDCLGLGIDESTAVFFRGRSMAVMGEGQAHLVYPASQWRPNQTEVLQPGQPDLDWTTLVRWSRDRQADPFPDPDATILPKVASPKVPHGSLLIVGGGGATKEIWQAFIDGAGGKEANIVVLPTAVENPNPRSGEANVFRRLGAKQVTVLTATDLETVGSKQFHEVLASATGIWFGGGRQWRFVDAYENTGAVEAIQQCLSRGGIIGGSSAGASIQGELMIRGAPVGNQIMVQDGYRKGFAFLPGTGIDQHFSQRDRFQDLEQTILQFPTILGIGIDESTALLVRGNDAQVLGNGSVYFYDAQLPSENRPVRADAGSTINLDSLTVQAVQTSSVDD